MTLDPDTEVVPTLGSKEAVFHLAQPCSPASSWWSRSRRTRSTSAAPCSRARRCTRSRCRRRRASCPTSKPCRRTCGRGRRSSGSTTPTTRRRRPPRSALYERAAALAREFDFVLACDEAYSEICFGAPPVSGLQVADTTNVAVFNTLSKRSSMPGYRSGFVAGDPELIAALKRYRPNVGVAPPDVRPARGRRSPGATRRTSREVRERYRAKRDVLLPALEARGLRSAGGDATFFLWLAGATTRLRRRAARAGRDRRAGRVLRGRPARATCGWRSSRRSRSASAPPELAQPGSRAARRSGRPRCRCAGAPRPRRSGSCGGTAGCSRPLSSRALTTSPSGSVTRAPAVR